MSQLIHSVSYTKGEVSIRYYLMTDLDVLINKEGVGSPPMTVLQCLPLGSSNVRQFELDHRGFIGYLSTKNTASNSLVYESRS